MSFVKIVSVTVEIYVWRECVSYPCLACNLTSCARYSADDLHVTQVASRSFREKSVGYQWYIA